MKKNNYGLYLRNLIKKMEEEGGSVATELPMCNYEKPSAVQMSITEKKTLIGDFGIMRNEIYMKKKI